MHHSSTQIQSLAADQLCVFHRLLLLAFIRDLLSMEPPRMPAISRTNRRIIETNSGRAATTTIIEVLQSRIRMGHMPGNSINSLRTPLKGHFDSNKMLAWDRSRTSVRVHSSGHATNNKCRWTPTHLIEMASTSPVDVVVGKTNCSIPINREDRYHLRADNSTQSKDSTWTRSPNLRSLQST